MNMTDTSQIRTTLWSNTIIQTKRPCNKSNNLTWKISGMSNISIQSISNNNKNISNMDMTNKAPAQLNKLNNEVLDMVVIKDSQDQRWLLAPDMMAGSKSRCPRFWVQILTLAIAEIEEWVFMIKSNFNTVKF